MKKALEGLSGVRKVEIDADRSEARMVVEKGKFDAGATAEAVRKAGFRGGQRVN